MHRLLIVLLVAAVSVPAWAKDDNDCQPLDVYMRSAKIYMGAMQKIPDFKSAQAQLDKAIECYPDASEAHYLLSKIFYRKRLYKDFLELAKALDSLDVKRVYADTVWEMRRAAWGELFNKGVDSLKASNDLDIRRSEIQDTDPALFDSLTNVGRRYLESAKGLFLASLEMDSSRSEPFQNIGVITVRLQQFDEAIVWYRKSLDVKPGDPDLMRNMVSLHRREGNLDSSLSYVQAILEVEPDDIEQLTNKAGLYAEMGFPDSANIVFEKIISQDPDNQPVIFNLGMTQVERAQSYADQIKRYSAQANEFTQEYNKLATSGASEKKLGTVKQKRDDAMTNLKDAMANSEEAWNQARGLFERLSGLDSADYQAHYFWGMSLFWLEQYDEAIGPLQTAVGLVPDYCEAWEVLKFAAARAGKMDVANTADAELQNCGS
jgi:tetratricopeptide (TPR) repeat protein